MNKSEKTYQIYTLEDPITNEIRYVGFTSRSLPDRCSKHINECKKRNDYKSNWIKSILKKGLKPLIKHLDFCDKTNWQIIEQYWIAQFNSWGFKLTNATDGGEGNVGRKYSKETLINLQQSHSKQAKSITQYDLEFNKIKEFPSINEAFRVTGCNKKSIVQNCKKLNNHKIGGLYYFRFTNDVDPFEIPKNLLIEIIKKRIVSEEEKNRIGNLNRGKKMTNEQKEHLKIINTGKKHSDSSRKKIRKNSTVKKVIIQYDLKGNFIKTHNSIVEASEKTAIVSTAISGCCRGLSKSSGGYMWKYKKENEDINLKIEPYIDASPLKKPIKIIQFSLDGTKINEFNSISEAVRQTKIKKIGEACKVKRKSAGGFIWKYA